MRDNWLSKPKKAESQSRSGESRKCFYQVLQAMRMGEDGVKRIKIGWKSLESQCVCLVTQLCLTLCNAMDCLPPGSSVHRNSPGKYTGVGCHAFLQGIFPTWGWNPGLLQCRQILYRLGHQGSPRILEWVACPFPRGSSQPRNWTGVSCTAGGFFTSWATRETP